MVKIIGKVTDNVRMSRIATQMRLLQQAALAYVMITGLAWAQDQETDQAQETGQEQVSEPAAKTIDLQIGMTEEEKVQAEEVLEESGETARGKEAALNEDPEAQRRSQLQEEPILRQLWKGIQIYGSVRLHAINNFNEKSDLTEFALGDGASRIGVRGELPLLKKWWLFGRAEAGFDVLDTFTAKSGNEENPEDGLTKRLLHGGFDSDNLTVAWGKNWSAYYKIAGMADRFSIFGGNAAGVYNAGTDGGPTGTGRADDVLQARIFTGGLSALKIKPFNLNLQYQYNRPIPWVEGERYSSAYGASAWLETEKDRGIGLAAQYSTIDNLEDPGVKAAGIDGDAKALAMAFRSFGDRWYAALVLARLENVMTTDLNKYVNGYGAELYAQWQFRDRWWLIGGGNWFGPDSDDPQAGEYEVYYYVVGLRYTLDSFNRMAYIEYRMDNGLLHEGTPRRNELTVGIRWDFGHR
jgi:hypothetical protein